MTTNGSARRLSINGNQVASIVDSTGVTTTLIAIGLQSVGTDTQVVSFTNFVYMPLD